MFQLSFIKAAEQLGNSFLATIQVTISYYSLQRISLNIPLLLLYLKSICSICHGNIGNVPVLKDLTHQRNENDPRTRIGDGSTPITNRNLESGFLNNDDNKKKRFSVSTTHMSKAGMGGTMLLRVRFEPLLSKKQCDLIKLQHCIHSGVGTPIYDKYDKATAYVRIVVRALIGHR